MKLNESKGPTTRSAVGKIHVNRRRIWEGQLIIYPKVQNTLLPRVERQNGCMRILTRSSLRNAQRAGMDGKRKWNIHVQYFEIADYLQELLEKEQKTK